MAESVAPYDPRGEPTAAGSGRIHEAPEQQPAAPRPASGDDAEELAAALAALRTAVQLELRADYADSALGGRRARHGLLARFGELAGPVAAWDEAVDRARAAPAALWDALASSVAGSGITEPPVAIGALIDRLAVITLERSRRGLLRAPHALSLQQLPARVKGDEVRSLYLDGVQVALLWRARSAAAELELDALARRIQALFDATQTSSAARAVDETRDALHVHAQRLLAVIDSCAAAVGV